MTATAAGMTTRIVVCRILIPSGVWWRWWTEKDCSIDSKGELKSPNLHDAIAETCSRIGADVPPGDFARAGECLAEWAPPEYR